MSFLIFLQVSFILGALYIDGRIKASKYSVSLGDMPMEEAMDVWDKHAEFVDTTASPILRWSAGVMFFLFSLTAASSFHMF